MSRTILHNVQENRFEYTESGLLCRLDYRLNGKIMHITHTGVPSALGGRGIARELAVKALETAETEGWKVQSHCSYIDRFLERNSNYQHLLLDPL